MTIQMTIALFIVVGMIVAIMMDKYSFSAPAIAAMILMVITGVSSVEVAFKGFVDANVIMVAGFMAVMAALQKTGLMDKIKSVMARLARRGGFTAYAAIILVVMLGSSVFGGGNTGFYVMVLTIAATIPYDKKLPNSKLLMPMGFSTGRAILPVSVAFFMGLSASLLDGTGFGDQVTMPKYSGMIAIMSVFYLIWTLLAFKLLPDYDVSGGKNDIEVKTEEKKDVLSKGQETLVYVCSAVSILGMMMASTIGEIAYVLPLLCTAVLVFAGVFSFKEAKNQVFSPLILMMASVIGVAESLANTGFTAMLGEAVARALGGNVNMFWLILIFCFLISACSTLTGASIGSVFVFAPIAIAACMSMGMNPTGLACAMVAAAWGGGFLPVDGLPAMILGMGKYKLKDFFKFSIPMYILQIFGLSLGAYLLFPN